MKKCPYCGRENDDNAFRCERCYAGFPSERKTKRKEPEPETEPVQKNDKE